MRRRYPIIAVIFCSLFGTKTFAQNLIAVEHNGVSSFYADLPTAVAAATNGDNIYISGGTYVLSANLDINATVNIYGAGYTVDSTLATGATIINYGTNTLSLNGSGTTISGIQFIGQPGSGLTFGHLNSVNNILVKRCSGAASYFPLTAFPCNNIYFSECIVSLFTLSNCTNTTIDKCIINGGIQNSGPTTVVSNSLFMGTGGYSIAFDSATYKNNIFLGTSNLLIGSTGQFYNNIIANFASGCLSGLVDVNNIYNIGTSNIFVSYSGSSYSEQDNYHLLSACPGRNAGTDGTDLGIYGTSIPFKAGGVPINPHLSFKQINSQTDGNGNLQINVTVNAQSN